MLLKQQWDQWGGSRSISLSLSKTACVIWPEINSELNFGTLHPFPSPSQCINLPTCPLTTSSSQPSFCLWKGRWMTTLLLCSCKFEPWILKLSIETDIHQESNHLKWSTSKLESCKDGWQLYYCAVVNFVPWILKLSIETDIHQESNHLKWSTSKLESSNDGWQPYYCALLHLSMSWILK